MTDLTESNETDYRVVETSVIPAVSHVRIYDETLTHIAEEHPEFDPFLPSLEHAIIDALANPTSVRASNAAYGGTSYKFTSEDHKRGNNQLVVPVKVVSGTSALVKTAYFADAVTGDVVWSRDHD